MELFEFEISDAGRTGGKVLAALGWLRRFPGALARAAGCSFAATGSLTLGVAQQSSNVA